MSALSLKVFLYAKSKKDLVVGSGECFDLADFALKNAGAKSAENYGVITDTADYVWGDFIDYQKATPGDIIQFRHYEMKTIITEEGYLPYKSRFTISRGHPNHTAVVSEVKDKGEFIVLEQNIGPGSGPKPVQEKSLFFGSPAPYRNGKEKIIITITGTYKFYRAQSK